MSAEQWFEYPVRAQPHHTDYGGVVWHGAYITWMESARVDYLRSLGIEFVDLVAMGCDLPVIDMSLRYHRFVKMGMAVIVKTRMMGMKGVRMHWGYQICSPDQQELYVTAQVTLVAVDRQQGKIMRQLPKSLQAALDLLTGS
ncbi:MAG: acyl-CoA thioesterase [Cyanothece sp. SIO1E1]|nr:acyl-CoA thioesterase [Cyanothece sp. SIO1E1]